MTSANQIVKLAFQIGTIKTSDHRSEHFPPDVLSDLLSGVPPTFLPDLPLHVPFLPNSTSPGEGIQGKPKSQSSTTHPTKWANRIGTGTGTGMHLELL